MRVPYADVVRVLIADDHLLFAEALEAILSLDGRIQVVGRAADGQQAVRLAEELRPDVVLMDLSMPRADGFDATRQIRDAHSETHVLVLTGSAATADVARAREAGADGYLTKDQIAQDLVRAILAAAGDS
jgi:DNA-binding NarL/FixJ family response regulator